MNKAVRLAALAVLALTLTCLCLAGPGLPHRIPHSGCVPRCAHYCRTLGLRAYQTCSSCYCYPADSGAGCGGWGCGGGWGHGRHWSHRRYGSWH